MFFKKLLANTRSSQVKSGLRAPEYPLETEAKLNRLHALAPARAHLDILHGDLHIGAERFVDLYFRCLEHTGTAVTPFNLFQRFQTRHDLVRYFLATLPVPGARVECGAYRGATALLLCHAWRAHDREFRGKGLYLIDSFTGTSPSSEHDLIRVRDESGERMEAFFPAGKSDVTAEMVRGFFADFHEVQIRTGWVPGVFGSLAEERYAFVHVDLTLFEATLAALDYFYPRLNDGGVMLCDGSIFCPGVDAAVERFSARTNTPYVVLGHRQYAFLKRSA